MRTKSFFLILSFYFILTTIQAQSVDDAFKQAKKENKIVMMFVESPDCPQCNDVADKGISGDAVKQLIKDSCVFIKTKSKDFDQLVSPSLFVISKTFFGIAYFDADRNILYIAPNSTSLSYTYLQNINLALKEKRETENNYAALKKNYYNRLNDSQSIRKLIEKILSMKAEPKQSLIDELTMKASEDSLNAVSFVQFIMRTAPLINSTALLNIGKNKDNYNVAWYGMSLQERKTINARLTNKSLVKAVSDKDMSYAFTVANYVQQTYTTNYEEGQKANQSIILQYYKMIKDTTNYLRNVSQFYERYYMNISADKAKADDSIALKKMVKNTINDSTKRKADSLRFVELGVKPPTGGTLNRVMVSYSPQRQIYAGALNEGAWTVYTYTKDVNYINKALTWARHGIEIYESPEIMDTYARLLYRTNNKEEAISWEQKAVDKRKEMKMPASEFEKVLNLMKSGAVKIDEY